MNGVILVNVNRPEPDYLVTYLLPKTKAAPNVILYDENRSWAIPKEPGK